MNELIISAANAPSQFSFKNQKLNDISAQIATQTSSMNALYTEARDRAEAINKALAPLFGELLVSKCYTDDGFKSVADYAEQTFGMGKSMAYMLARVGKEYYKEGAESTELARNTLSTSKLAELTGVDRIAVANAIESGELTSDTPLAAVREFAATHRKPGKEKVLPTYDVYAMPRHENDGPQLVDVLKEDFIPSLIASDDDPNNYTLLTVKLNGDKASAAQHFVLCGVEGGMIGSTAMYEYRPHMTKKAAKSKTKREKFDLAAYIATLSPEERENLAAMVARSDNERIEED